MTRQQRRSKSQYLNACRKVGYKPSKGFVYKKNRRGVRCWCQQFRFVLTLTKEQFQNMFKEEE